MSGHVPPQDLDAERAVIGSILMSASALDDCAEILNPGDFYQPRHEHIFRAALAVQARQEAVDALTVGDELAKVGLTQQTGGGAYLHECIDATPNYGNAAHYAEIVVEKAKRRNIDAAARRILAAVESGTSDADAILERAEEEIGHISAARQRVAVKPLSQTLEQTIAALDSGLPAFTSTPWADLDWHIHGWRPGALHVIGARPGGGKSLMGLQAALGMAKTGKAVTYAVMEMDTDELNIRLLAQSTNVGMDSLSKRTLSAMEWEKIRNKVPHLSGLPLYVDDMPRQTIAHIRAHARHVARRADLGMIVVDYIQQVQTPEHLLSRPRHEQVAHTTSALKALSREMNVPVLAMAQVNRGAADRQDKAPQMGDLRESGSIEADADVIALLSRDHDDSPEVDCYVRKARQGRLGHFKLAWFGMFARLENHANPYGRNERHSA